MKRKKIQAKKEKQQQQHPTISNIKIVAVYLCKYKIKENKGKKVRGKI